VDKSQIVHLCHFGGATYNKAFFHFVEVKLRKEGLYSHYLIIVVD